ncbi:MAG: hypothetical protein GY765_20380 [bacterium]|nr:hypothetical protein [bacterium]
MKVLQMVFLIALLIISTNCSTKKDHPIKRIKTAEVPCPLRLVKEKETRIQSEGHPGFVRDEYSDYIMVRMEKKNTAFLEYDEELQLQRKHVIAYGQGPDECLLPMVAGKDIEAVYILDVTSKRYYAYDHEFKNRKKLDSKGLEPNWIPQGTYYSAKEKTILTCFSNFINMKENGFHVYLRRINGKKLTDTKLLEMKFTVESQKKQFVIGTPLHYTLTGDSVYILKKTNYSLMKVDLKGNVLKEIFIEDLDPVSFSNRRREEWIDAMGIKLSSSKFTVPGNLWHPCWIIPLGDGIAVGRRDNYKPDEKEWIDADYYDKNLEYRGKVKLPWFSHWNNPSHINAEMFLYSKGDKLYFIQERISDTEEEYYLTRWRIVDEKR